MWLDADEICAGLASGDGEQVAAALAALHACVECLQVPAIGAPTAAVLAVFAGRPPDQVRSDYIGIIEHGEYFTPPLSRADQVLYLLDAQSLDEHCWYALEASLRIKVAAEPLGLLDQVFLSLRSRNTSPASQRALACWLDFMLDGDLAIRHATGNALRAWADGGNLPVELAPWLSDLRAA